MTQANLQGRRDLWRPGRGPAVGAGQPTGGPLVHVLEVISAGTFYHADDRVFFWGVRDPKKTVVIRLTDERCARLVIEVEDQPATVAVIQEAIGQG